MVVHTITIFIVYLASRISLAAPSLTQWDLSSTPIPALQNKNRAFIGYYNDTISMLGGYNSPNDSLEFPLDASWSTSKEMNMIFGMQFAQSSVQIDEVLWMLPIYSQNLNLYNLATNSITNNFTFPGIAGLGRCVTQYNGYIIVIGGLFINNSNYEFLYQGTLYALNTATENWIIGASLNTPRTWHSCNTVGNTIYAIGGQTSGPVPLKTVEYLQLNTCCNGAWIPMSDTLSSAKDSHRSVVFEEYVYIIGGSGSIGIQGEVDIINTQSQTILPTKPMTYGKTYHSAIVIGHFIHVFGGDPSGLTNQYYQYSIIPTAAPTIAPTRETTNPSYAPTYDRTSNPSKNPTENPTEPPTFSRILNATEISITARTTDREWLQTAFTITSVGTLSMFGIVTISGYFITKYIWINHFFKVSAWITVTIHVLDMISDVFFSIYANFIPNGRIISMISAATIVIPILVTIIQLWKHMKKHWFKNDKVRSWLSKHTKLLYLISILTGSSFSAIELFNSNLFGLEMFDMGLTRTELMAFSYKRVYSIISLENLPQLILQIAFLFMLEKKLDIRADLILIASLSFTVISIIVAILAMCVQKQILFEQDIISIEFDVKGPSVVEKSDQCRNLIRSFHKKMSTILGFQKGIIEVLRPYNIPNGYRLHVNILIDAGTDTTNKIETMISDSITAGQVQSALTECWELTSDPTISNVSVTAKQSKKKTRLQSLGETQMEMTIKNGDKSESNQRTSLNAELP